MTVETAELKTANSCAQINISLRETQGFSYCGSCINRKPGSPYACGPEEKLVFKPGVTFDEVRPLYVHTLTEQPLQKTSSVSAIISRCAQLGNMQAKEEMPVVRSLIYDLRALRLSFINPELPLTIINNHEGNPEIDLSEIDIPEE